MRQQSRLIKNVTFLGYSEALKTDELYQQAFDAAAAVAKRGYVIVNGGGPGVMRAATEGAHYVGGRAIGITFYPKGQMRFEGADPENKVDELIVAKNYLERTLKLLEYGDVYILFNGGTGTISSFWSSQTFNSFW
jgi:predicted Rossmann-fold nucleotide-binding protein